jgi:uncharacterized protein (DUF2267 family)
MLVRGIFYPDWNPSRVPMKQNREDFMQRIREQFHYQIECGIEQLERTVLQALRRYITDGGWDDIKSAMPKDLAAAFP